ncbi:MAG: hypothetical protein ACI4J7_09875 [Ruminiclostridium sp.]
METRQINLPLETARRWYEQGGELKEMALGAFDEKELIEYRLPKSWEEYRTMKGDKGEKANAALSFAYTSINSAFADYHDTQKHIALMKLHLLRDEYRRGWKPDCDKDSYSIIRDSDDIYVGIWSSAFYFLSFEDNKIGNEFLNNFRELIEEAGDLI